MAFRVPSKSESVILCCGTGCKLKCTALLLYSGHISRGRAVGETVFGMQERGSVTGARPLLRDKVGALGAPSLLSSLTALWSPCRESSWLSTWESKLEWNQQSRDCLQNRDQRAQGAETQSTSVTFSSSPTETAGL